MRNDITLYFPGDGVKESSNSATYKGIKEFTKNPDGTVTFKTTKHGLITTPCLWRLKENLADDAAVHEDGEVVAGNRGRRQY